MKPASVARLALPAVFLLGLGAFGQERTVADDLGHRVALPAAPERIVSMAPNVTEILFALGLGGRVVGVTRFCDHPEPARDIPKIGGLVDPNIEIILARKPDLIVAFRGNPLRVLDRLRGLRLPVFVLDIGTDLGSLAPLISKIGRVTGKEAEAESLNASLRTRIGEIDRKLAGPLARPRVFAVLFSQGLWTCGAESYLDSLISRAGAVSVAARVPKKWFLYTRERLVRDDPEAIIVLAQSDEDFSAARDRILGEASYRDIAAVRTGRIFRLDEDAASRFGPRLVDVLERLARLLHPERFGEAP